MTKSFWYQLVERAVKSFCQMALTLIVIDPATSRVNVSWGATFYTAAVAALLSVLTSLASLKIAESGTASVAPGAAQVP